MHFLSISRDSLERELRVTKQSLKQKNEEFSAAADGLEMELSALKSQLEAMEGEKQLVLRDKESLLEEVRNENNSGIFIRV